MQMIILILSVLVIPSSYALDTDLGVNAFARSTKLAAVLEGQGGVSQVLWGSAGAGPNFGYVRASAALRTSGLANGYRAQLEVYPISIFGITLGRQYLSRFADAPGIDCTRFDCGTDVISHYLQFRSVFKFGNIFGQVTFQKDIFDDHYYSLPRVFEPTNQYAIDRNGDYGTTWGVVTGYEINPKWSAGIAYLTSHAKVTNQDSMSILGFAKWKPSEITYALTLGAIDTDVIGSAPQVAFTLSWWPKARIGF